MRSDGVASLSLAFAAFCKECRDEELSDAEVSSLLYCNNLSLFPLKPAVFDLRLPYPEYQTYTCTPPDILHTFLGGLLKDWIFHVCVIVCSVCLAGHGDGRNLHTLDNLLRHFPILHSMPFFMRKFQKGVSEYVRKASDGSRNEKGTLLRFFVGFMRLLFQMIRFF